MQVGDMVVIRTETHWPSFGQQWIITKDFGDKCQLCRFEPKAGWFGNGKWFTMEADKVMIQIVQEYAKIIPPQGGSSSTLPPPPPPPQMGRVRAS